MKKKFLKKELVFQFNIFYIMVMLVLVPLITLLFFFQGRRVLYKVMSSDMTSLLEKSVQISDAKLLAAKEYTLGFLADNETKRLIVATTECKNDVEYYFIDKAFKQLSNKYFMASPDIYSVNVIVGNYSLGTESGKNFIPKNKFKDTDIYKSVKKNRDNMIWMPTYRFYEMYDQKKFKELYSLDYYYIFSLVRNLSDLYEETDKQTIIDPCVLMVNFVDGFWADVFSKDMGYDNLEYMVADQSGTIITHNHKSYIATDYAKGWIDQVSNNDVGTVTITIDNRKNLIFYKRSEVTGWISMYNIPMKDINTFYFQMLSRYSVIILFVVLISIFFFSIVIKRLIVVPVVLLTKEVEKLKEQPYYQIKEQGSYEIRNLATTYNNMHRSMQELMKKNFEIQKLYQETKLKEINLQLNPHFIYNILNMLNLELIRDGKYESCKILDDVTYMMRYVLDNDNITEVFEKDLRYTLHYVDVMNRRYKGLYQLELDIDPQLNNTEVPKFMLQPIIENSYRHAFIETNRKTNIIRIKCFMKEGKRYFCVEDNGRGMDDKTLFEINEGKRGSVGLNNTRWRVRYIYGKDAKLVAEHGNENTKEGTKITIILP